MTTLGATTLALFILGSVISVSSVAHAQVPLLPSTPIQPVKPQAPSSTTAPINTTSMPTSSTPASLSFTNATGTIASFQNNQTGKPHGSWAEQIARKGIWLVSGNWSLVFRSGSGGAGNMTAPTFDASFSMMFLNGTAMHTHKISDFTMTGIPTRNGAENSTTFKGTSTVTLKDGPHTNVPISITITDKSAISIVLDRTQTGNHFGPTPIFGTVTKLG